MDELRYIDTTGLYSSRPFRSAVAILLTDRGNGPEILFEVRSSKIPDQPGDICFPGGMLEEGETPLEAVCREAREELLIHPEQLEITGRMSPFQNGQMVIYPFVGRLKDYSGSFNAEESEEVFTIPLQFLLEHEPESFPEKWVVILGEDFPYDRIVGGRNYRWRDIRSDNYFWQYEGRNLWGLTAKILRAWLKAEFPEPTK